MSHLILSHLSKNNNTPEIVQSLFETHADGVKIIIASRDSASKVYMIGRKDFFIHSAAIKADKKQQLSLF